MYHFKVLINLSHNAYNKVLKMAKNIIQNSFHSQTYHHFVKQIQ